MIKALFLDRDGVINEDFGYVYKEENFKFMDDVFEVLRYYQNLGYELFIITNQSGIARGYYTKDEFLNLTKFMLNELEKEQIYIKKVYFCPHSPDDNCSCRKPKPGMILKAKDEFDIDLKKSIFFGDKISDMGAGKAAGVGDLYLINSKLNPQHNTYFKTFKNILQTIPNS
ncbi:D-glycero-beta-D-manno-heptose 1,7-bisphosphate 7-phosphatase [Campylobacter corcagiensis]|uniref:D,D-heptose 1,7-bisphosphate phosphatase n=1 Tax=Campylobacter corcagiensis TaxID=1448857 RepID=A0A7M1LFC4_9BACT|nr:D-glycero-beta-D-manno-heptose 1,7-bisphosphate 7-phosphatase [Campylobacter corcagiensis]QKF65089.1 D,D-heptose 1,7-bisphosphate phosphatase [Campylobacter corcagiensis]QOQ86764.1 D-glycero-beta-D-manno-heptose 1,7-bisphosphate 7-phosphatase [Campylobacter corcagiensis]